MYAKMFLSRDHPQLRIMDLEQAVDRVQNFMATQLLQLILLEGHLGGAAWDYISTLFETRFCWVTDISSPYLSSPVLML